MPEPTIEVKTVGTTAGEYTPRPSVSGDRQAALQKAFEHPTNNPQPKTEESKSNVEVGLDLFTDDNPTPAETPEQESTPEDNGEVKVEEIDSKAEDPKFESLEEPQQKEEQKVEDKSSKSENPPFRPAKRDYTKYDPELIPLLKKLPNNQFEIFEKYSTGKKDLESKLSKLNEDLVKAKANNLPESWQEHPQSYTLTPEYQTISKDLTYDDFEQSHWTEQLIAIREGRDWFDLEGYDEKTGQPKYILRKSPEEGKVDHKSEIEVSQYLNNVGANKNQRLQMLHKLQAVHQQFHNQAISSIKEAENKFFPQWSDSSKIPANVKSDIDAVINAMHPAFKNHPLAILPAKSYAYVRQVLSLYKQAQDKIKILEDKFKDGVKAGPPNTRFNTGNSVSKSNGKMISLSDFTNT